MIRILMGCRMAALDKQPGIHPVGIGEMWRRLFAKLALLIAGEDTKAACGSKQLCAGLEAGIKDAVNSVLLRTKGRTAMDFGDWEVDDGTWLAECEPGQGLIC